MFFSIVLSTVGNTIIKSCFGYEAIGSRRLFSPGTLFEESAIRREIKVATILGKTDLLALLVRNPARLYYAASLASSVTAHEAEQLLQNISCKDLSKKDRLLFIAAQAVAQKVTSSLVDGQKEVKIQDSTQPQNQKELDTMSKKAVQQQNAPSSTSTGINQLIEQAQEKINEVDKLLGT
ncbi:hypothetical protein [Bartonella melophagi]|uniref:Uncharacterized protein n=1 Tax=Bartonella melophagi K-2C TaxID=1094557 RepID=J0ZJN9_9HYPH|nr:hypothetical protein [Bartonella melophagi]EJF88518.1 hypothetical protein ME3_01070 [Bartonella melophagi K-2C]